MGMLDATRRGHAIRNGDFLSRREPVAASDDDLNRRKQTSTRPSLERVGDHVSEARRRPTVIRLVEQRPMMRGGQPKCPPISLVRVAVDVGALVLQLLHPASVLRWEGVRVTQLATEDEERRVRRNALRRHIMVTLLLIPLQPERRSAVTLSDGREFERAVLDESSIILLDRVEATDGTEHSNRQSVDVVSRSDDVTERGDRRRRVDRLKHERLGPAIRLRKVYGDDRRHRIRKEEQILQMDPTPIWVRRVHHLTPLLMGDVGSQDPPRLAQD